MVGEELFRCIKESAMSIDNPRFYETERGFQGQLVAEICKRYNDKVSIVEQEYQKSLIEHGLNIRPDIIIHQPFDKASMKSRRYGNSAVIELKLNGSRKSCMDDYRSLDSMCHYLGYPLAIFINISSEVTFMDEFRGNYKDRFRSFGVTLGADGVKIHE